MKNQLTIFRSGALPGYFRATFIAGLCVVAFTPASDALAQGMWTSIAPLPIGVSSGSNGVAFHGKFYVIDGTNGVIQAPQVYDPVTDSWSAKTADPVVRSESAAGVIDNRIYVAEGWLNSDSNNSTTALEIYDPSTDSWTAGTPSLIARGLSTTAVIGGKLYVVGGTAAGYVNFANLEIYDPLTNSWSMGAPLPRQLTSAGGTALNGKFYVLGGYAGPSAFHNKITASVEIYDPVLNTWSIGTRMPTARANMVVGIINGRLCVASGNIADGSHDSSVVVYDPITDRWSSAAAEPTARSNAAAAVVGIRLFVAGGNTDTGPYTTAAEVFTPGRIGAAGTARP